MPIVNLFNDIPQLAHSRRRDKDKHDLHDEHKIIYNLDTQQVCASVSAALFTGVPL